MDRRERHPARRVRQPGAVRCRGAMAGLIKPRSGATRGPWIGWMRRARVRTAGELDATGPLGRVAPEQPTVRRVDLSARAGTVGAAKRPRPHIRWRSSARRCPHGPPASRRDADVVVPRPSDVASPAVPPPALATAAAEAVMSPSSDAWLSSRSPQLRRLRSPMPSTSPTRRMRPPSPLRVFTSCRPWHGPPIPSTGRLAGRFSTKRGAGCSAQRARHMTAARQVEPGLRGSEDA